jgi:hypothetical protein
MAGFSRFGHKVYGNRWVFKGHSIPLTNTDNIVDQLKGVQNSKGAVLETVSLDPDGGSIGAKYGLVLARMGRPQYFEYMLLNNANNSFAVVNGLIGFLNNAHTSNGVVLANTFCMGESAWSYNVAGCGAKINPLNDFGLCDCYWESATDTEGSLATIRVGSSGSTKWVFVIKGRSRKQELNGVMSVHTMYCNDTPLLKIYPEGRWTYTPQHFWKRYIRDIIPVIDYLPAYSGLLSGDIELGVTLMVFGLGICRALQWPVQSLDSGFAST